MKGFDMGDKGKKDRGKREGQKKGKQTVKEKRKTKKDKLQLGLPN